LEEKIVKTNEKRSDWFLTKIFLIVFVILFLIDFALLKISGESYKGGFSFGKVALDVLTIALILSLAGLGTVAFYETARYLLRKNKENENST
jgi:fumarate reductase subunit C